ncbi:hypothetical protein HPB47_021352, partial [Ixodes persulcatus]
HMDALHFQVVVKCRTAVRKLTDAGSLSIGGNLVPLVPVGPQVTAVTVLFLPAHVPDELLVRSLAQHGKVQKRTWRLQGHPKYGNALTETALHIGADALTSPREENPLDHAAAEENLGVDERSDEAEEETMEVAEKTEEPGSGEGSMCVYTPSADKRTKAKQENAKRSEASTNRQKLGLKKTRKDSKGTPYDRDE